MTVECMRESLKNTPKYHKAPTWIHKVEKMSDKQVIAVYYRMLEERPNKPKP